MAIIILLGIPLLVIFIMYVNKIYIDWRSILSKSLPLDRGKFGVYCFTGKQGSGKTYSLTKYLIKYGSEKQIYSNIPIKGIKYTPIRSVQHLLTLKDEKNLYIVFDEIFTLIEGKTLPHDIRKELMEFLTQQRKMKNIFLTTAQEWLELPMTYRRFVRIQIECETIALGQYGGVLMEEYFDARKMKWSQLDNEYIAPRIEKKFSKYEAKYMQAYDTYGRIKPLPKTDRLTAASAQP